MQFILDTHSLLWFFSGDLRLSFSVRNIIEDMSYQKLISLANIWEIAIKISKNKLTLTVSLEDYIQKKLELEDFKLMNIELKHIMIVSTLPFYHNDPFDRLLISQASADDLPIISSDLAFAAYPMVGERSRTIQRIWD